MVLAGIWILGCQATAKHPATKATEGNGKASSHNIPPLIEHQGLLPVPQILPKTETYTISVHQVPLKELLFSLARDAGINADIHPDVGGLMTLNATNQTLIQILDRIAQQIPLRYEIGHNNLLISPDVPYFYTYHIDYVNVSRGTKSEITVATEIATTGGSVAQGASGGEKNSSKTKIESEIYNDFWGILVNNIQRIISDNITAATGDKKSPMGSANVIVNPISGLINVKATQKQHLQVRQFIDKAVGSALKQVLIEATILEIELNNSFQTGVDWQRLSRNNGQGGNGPSLTAGVIDPSLLSPPMYLLQYNNVTSDLGNISAMIALLEQFGQVRVLSSPKLMTLNNQPAILKVVDEKVYFTVQRQITEATQTSAAPQLSSPANARETPCFVWFVASLAESNSMLILYCSYSKCICQSRCMPCFYGAQHSLARVG